MQPVMEKKIAVFLVDDHKTVLWGLERLIESADTRMRVVGTAESCEQLFAKLPSVRPDVILLDLDLGGSSGLDCLEKLALREKEQYRALILTGSNDPAVHQQAVVRGARGVVHKQVAADVLLRAIEKVYQGEIWLDQATLGRVMATISNGDNKFAEARKLELLTNKERLVVTALVQEKGGRNKVIADKLHMSEHTLRNHLTAIYGKLQVAGRMELYLYAVNEMGVTTES